MSKRRRESGAALLSTATSMNFTHALPDPSTPTVIAEASPDPVLPVLTPAAGVRSRIGRVNLAGVAKPASSKKGTDYPVLPDPNGEHARIAQRIRERREQIESLEGQLATDEAEIKALATPFWFQHGRGLSDVPSSVAVPYPGGQVLVSFTSRYKALPDAAPLERFLPAALLDELFQQSFTFTVDGDQIPVDQAQAVVNELAALFARHGCSGALTVKETVKPSPTFPATRHQRLTPEQNLALQEACPCIVAVKTKGRA